MKYSLPEPRDDVRFVESNPELDAVAECVETKIRVVDKMFYYGRVSKSALIFKCLGNR